MSFGSTALLKVLHLDVCGGLVKVIHQGLFVKVLLNYVRVRSAWFGPRQASELVTVPVTAGHRYHS